MTSVGYTIYGSGDAFDLVNVISSSVITGLGKLAVFSVSGRDVFAVLPTGFGKTLFPKR